MAVERQVMSGSVMDSIFQIQCTIPRFPLCKSSTGRTLLRQPRRAVFTVAASYPFSFKPSKHSNKSNLFQLHAKTHVSITRFCPLQLVVFIAIRNHKNKLLNLDSFIFSDTRGGCKANHRVFFVNGRSFQCQHFTAVIFCIYLLTSGKSQER